MPVPPQLKSAISGVMGLKRNKEAWMSMQPDMQDELGMAFEGQMGQAKNELSEVTRGMAIPGRPDYPGGSAINLRQGRPTLLGGLAEKAKGVASRAGKAITGEGYGKEGFSRWDDEFRKQRYDVNTKLGKTHSAIENRQKEIADEMTWLSQNKESVNPDTYKTEMQRLMKEFGETDKQRKKIQVELDSYGERGKSQMSQPLEEDMPHGYQGWDETTRMEHDKIKQEFQRIDARYEAAKNPDIKRALLSDRVKLQEEYRRLFGRHFGKEPRPSKYGPNTGRERDQKLRDAMAKTMYGNKYGSVLDSAARKDFTEAGADVTATEDPSEKPIGAAETLAGLAGPAMTMASLAPRAIPGTIGMMGLEEYIKDAPPPNIQGGRIRLRPRPRSTSR
jgi:hypothetical protein